MLRHAIIAAVVVFAAPTALRAQNAPTAEQAAESFSIAPGETVTARIVGRRFVVVSRGSGEASGDAPQGTVRFSMTGAQSMTMLEVENGTGRPFEYRARMVLGRRSAATSTCTVLPGVAGMEHWPHALDRLELSAPTLLGGARRAIRCR